MSRVTLTIDQLQRIAEVLYGDAPAPARPSLRPDDIEVLAETIGRHRVAPSLYLDVRRSRRDGWMRSWSWRYMVSGQRRHMGLGTYTGPADVPRLLQHIGRLRADWRDPVQVAKDAKRMTRDIREAVAGMLGR
jgi:hypothetical protein